MKRWLVLFVLLLSLVVTPFVGPAAPTEAHGCEAWGEQVRFEADAFHPLGQTLKSFGLMPVNDDVAAEFERLCT